MLTEKGIKIGGTEYTWKRVSIREFKRLQKFYLDGAINGATLFNEENEYGGLIWNQAVEEWKQFISAIIENPDEKLLTLDNLSDVDFWELSQGFFTGRATDTLGLLGILKRLPDISKRKTES